MQKNVVQRGVVVATQRRQSRRQSSVTRPFAWAGYPRAPDSLESVLIEEQSDRLWGIVSLGDPTTVLPSRHRGDGQWPRVQGHSRHCRLRWAALNRFEDASR